MFDLKIVCNPCTSNASKRELHGIAGSCMASQHYLHRGPDFGDLIHGMDCGCNCKKGNITAHGCHAQNIATMLANRGKGKCRGSVDTCMDIFISICYFQWLQVHGWVAKGGDRLSLAEELQVKASQAPAGKSPDKAWASISATKAY